MVCNTSDDMTHIIINIAKQTLFLYQSDVLTETFTISTGKNGIGNLEGSGQTPLGRHVITEKIGADEPMNAVFVGRVPTGETYTQLLGEQAPKRDWILTRILWLSGCEQGINQGHNSQGCCDTHARYIYIHGTPDSEPMGVPMSHGCIRMRNADVMRLFDEVSIGTKVDILAK